MRVVTVSESSGTSSIPPSPPAGGFGRGGVKAHGCVLLGRLRRHQSIIEMGTEALKRYSTYSIYTIKTHNRPMSSVRIIEINTSIKYYFRMMWSIISIGTLQQSGCSIFRHSWLAWTLRHYDSDCMYWKHSSPTCGRVVGCYFTIDGRLLVLRDSVSCCSRETGVCHQDVTNLFLLRRLRLRAGFLACRV